MKIKKFRIAQITAILLTICSSTLYGQEIETFKPRNFNIGTSFGIGVVHMIMLPTLDIKLCGLTVKGSYGFQFTGYSAEYEFSKVKFPIVKNYVNPSNLWFITQFGFSHQRRAICIGECQDYKVRDILTAGIGFRYYRGPRSSLSFKAGPAYVYILQFENFRRSVKTKILPFGEFAFSYVILQ